MTIDIHDSTVNQLIQPTIKNYKFPYTAGIENDIFHFKIGRHNAMTDKVIFEITSRQVDKTEAEKLVIPYTNWMSEEQLFYDFFNQYAYPAFAIPHDVRIIEVAFSDIMYALFRSHQLILTSHGCEDGGIDTFTFREDTIEHHVKIYPTQDYENIDLTIMIHQ